MRNPLNSKDIQKHSTKQYKDIKSVLTFTILILFPAYNVKKVDNV